MEPVTSLDPWNCIQDDLIIETIYIIIFVL